MRCFALACLVAVTACSSQSPTAPSPINQEIVLSPAQSLPIDRGTVAVRLLGVPVDSRCPADVQCVHAGSARVDVQVTSVFDIRIVSFETGDPKPARFGTLTLELVQLGPYPVSATRPINPADYRATLRVTR